MKKWNLVREASTTHNFSFFLISREREWDTHRKLRHDIFFFLWYIPVKLHFTFIQHTHRLFRLWSFVEIISQTWNKHGENSSNASKRERKIMQKNFLPENISDCNKNLILDMKFYCLKSNRGSWETFNAFFTVNFTAFFVYTQRKFFMNFPPLFIWKNSSTRENFTHSDRINSEIFFVLQKGTDCTKNSIFSQKSGWLECWDVLQC